MHLLPTVDRSVSVVAEAGGVCVGVLAAFRSGGAGARMVGVGGQFLGRIRGEGAGLVGLVIADCGIWAAGRIGTLLLDMRMLFPFASIMIDLRASFRFFGCPAELKALQDNSVDKRRLSRCLSSEDLQVTREDNSIIKKLLLHIFIPSFWFEEIFLVV